VLEVLRERKLKLIGILVTHHHWDHTDGISELLEHVKVPVYGPGRDQVPTCTHPLSHGDRVQIPELDCEFSVLDIPGHTLGHIAFVGLGGVFCGDTLFSAGCGRIFEGTPEQMFQSLRVLAELPEETRVYCAHEYTQANLQFAKAVEPNNKEMLTHIDTCMALRARQQPTLPSSIKLEKAINLFLRCSEPSVRASVVKQVGHTLDSPLAIFTALREWKNTF
jgi:hydroxyacylglutathione hydrolase